MPAGSALAVYDALLDAGVPPRDPAGRAEVARLAADGEGLPRLRPRHRQHRRPRLGRSRVRGRLGQAGLRRALGRAGSQGGRDAVEAAGADPAARSRSRCSTTPSRCSATASWSATCARRRTAGRSARPSAWRSSTAAEPVTADWLVGGFVAGRRRRHAVRRRGVAAADVRPALRAGAGLTVVTAGRSPRRAGRLRASWATCRPRSVEVPGGPGTSTAATSEASGCRRRRGRPTRSCRGWSGTPRPSARARRAGRAASGRAPTRRAWP